MLRIALDDAATQRLILRAPRRSPLDLARRGLAAGLGAGAVGCAIVVPRLLLSSPYHLLWSVPVGVMAAWWFVTLHGWETTEIGVDGSRSVLWVCRRERLWWIPKREEVSFENRAAYVAVASGLAAPEGPARPEIGLVLWRGRLGNGDELLAPLFSVERVDRRDEARALVDLLARRLGLRIEQKSEGLTETTLRIGQRGDEPAAENGFFGGYRDRATRPGVPFDRPASFEEPPRAPPSLDEAGAVELRETLRRDGRAWAVETTRREAAEAFAWRAAASLLVAVLTAFATGAVDVGTAAGAVLRLPAYVAVPLGLLLATAGAAGGGYLLAAAAMWTAHRIADALRGAGSLPWLFAGQPRRWRLAPDGLVVEGWFRRTLRLSRGGEARLVLLRSAMRSSGGSRYRAQRHYFWRELWLHDSGRWRRLARTRETEGKAAATPALDALAVEVARTLDAPLRGAH